MEANQLYKCAACGVESDITKWDEGWEPCDDCGEHSALKCPACGEYLDHVWNDDVSSELGRRWSITKEKP